MDEQASARSAQPQLLLPQQPGRPWLGGSNWSWIVLLLVLTTAMRIWQVSHTEVVSRDTLSYIRVAWQLEQGDCRAVLRGTQYHPGYPATILAMSRLVRPLTGADLVTGMQLSAQWASIVSGILLVIPMFLLGREFFEQRISFWATLLFQCLPTCSRVLADGLSESLFLLLSSTSFLFAAKSLRNGSLLGLAVSGLAGGLAYLTRPEGAALVVATGLVVLLMQAFRASRCSLGRLCLRGVSLATPALLVAVPYMLVIGHFTAKQSALSVVQVASLEGTADSAEPQPQGVRPLVVVNLPLAIWKLDDRGSSNPYIWTLWAFSGVLVRAFFYVLWVPALIGLWVYRDRVTGFPGIWVMVLVNLALMAALFRIAVNLGYISDRHLMLLVLCLSYWTVAGIVILGQRLAAWQQLRHGLQENARWKPHYWSLLLLVVLTGIPLGKSLQPLHDNRVGFRMAGYWIRENTNPNDPLVDPLGWTYYYAGRLFQEPLPGTSPLPAPPARYVLLEETGNQHPHLSGWALATNLIEKGHGQVVHTWELKRGKILLYEVSLPPATNLP
jgi:Dolichyl-phosphate-mannose-protein mannosyltransferase